MNTETPTTSARLLPVLVVEDDRVCRLAVTSLLVQGGLPLVEPATSGRHALEILRQERVGILLTEVTLPDLALPTLLAEARAIQPWLQVVALTGEHDNDLLAHALSYGLCGLLSKYANPLQLARRIVAASVGGLVLDEITAAVIGALLSERRHAAAVVLTDREREVLSLLHEGHTARSAGRRLRLAESTVKSHAAKAATRLGVRSSREAAARAWQLGLLDAGVGSTEALSCR